MPGSDCSRRSAASGGHRDDLLQPAGHRAGADDGAGPHRLHARPVPLPGRDAPPDLGEAGTPACPAGTGRAPGPPIPEQQPPPGPVRLHARTTFCSSTAGTSASMTRPVRPMRSPGRRRASWWSTGCTGIKPAGSSSAPSAAGSVRSSQDAPGPQAAARMVSGGAAAPAAGAAPAGGGTMAGGERLRPGPAAAAGRDGGVRQRRGAGARHLDRARPVRGQRGAPHAAVGHDAQRRVTRPAPVHGQRAQQIDRERWLPLAHRVRLGPRHRRRWPGTGPAAQPGGPATAGRHPVRLGPDWSGPAGARVHPPMLTRPGAARGPHTPAHTSVENRTQVGPSSSPGHTRSPARSSLPGQIRAASPITTPSSTTPAPIIASPADHAAGHLGARADAGAVEQHAAADVGIRGHLRARADHGPAAHPGRRIDPAPGQHQQLARSSSARGQGGGRQPAEHQVAATPGRTPPACPTSSQYAVSR